MNKAGGLAITCIRSHAPDRGSIYTFVVSPEKLGLFLRLRVPETLRTLAETQGADLLPLLEWSRDWQSGRLLVAFSRKMDFHLQARINRTHSVGNLQLPTGRTRAGLLAGGQAGRDVYQAALEARTTLSIVAFEVRTGIEEATQ